MSSDPPLLEVLTAKAMLLLRREREVFELRAQRGRVELWLSVFQAISADLNSKDPAALLDQWASLMMSELSFQVAAAYICDPGLARLQLAASRSPVPLLPALHLSSGDLESLYGPEAGEFRHGTQDQIPGLAASAGIESFFWLSIAMRRRCVVLIAGFASSGGRSYSLDDYDFGHFLLFGKHLAALMENSTLIEELDRERSELTLSNAQLDRSLRKLREAQAKLLLSSQSLAQVSRRAGMADIATGVLHNVGNSLNSVNIAADLAAERLRALRISGVLRVAELLEQHADDLPQYFANDPRASALPRYLRELGEHLGSHVSAIAEELHTLRHHIDHIKSIVGKQQAYAKTMGVSEPTVASQLMDDALGLLQDSLQKLGVELIKDYAEVPELLLDRHKVLQILVNLLSNAKHALAESQSPQKQVRLSVGLASDGVDLLRFSVQDNGVGVAEEHRPLLFTHGFTTKKNGHGFGLHTSALAAREMGGALSFSSAGAGTGATFVLDLPAKTAVVKLIDNSEAPDEMQ